MCSIARSVLERSPMCARAQVTALKTHGPAGEAMAARAMQADKACARSQAVRSSACNRFENPQQSR